MPVPQEVTACQESNQLPMERFNGAGGLNTMVKEDLEDWVDNFKVISLSEVPLGVEGVGQAGSSGTSQSPSTSKSNTTTSSQHMKQLQAQELGLILDFLLPQTFIPSPTKSTTPLSALPPPEVTPIHDDGSVFYDHNPFYGIHSLSRHVLLITKDSGAGGQGSEQMVHRIDSIEQEDEPNDKQIPKGYWQMLLETKEKVRGQYSKGL
ncbi:hypothetical protein F5148DRAFT_1280486 [Russula earlei]|uniref:Uncharacterized protein n=1 Tax=Russula earlei TaxID=71964 RepID=A0ACC0UJ06_9AGAM|nr:hypothetical protein F5148DRAFT_1280486 [Russula earlei]